MFPVAFAIYHTSHVYNVLQCSRAVVQCTELQLYMLLKIQSLYLYLKLYKTFITSIKLKNAQSFQTECHKKTHHVSALIRLTAPIGLRAVLRN